MDRPQDEVIRRVAELEEQHGGRRAYPWQKLGLSPLATALGPLSQLASLCLTDPGAPTPEAYAEFYASDGWRVDAAALATMAACGTPEQHSAVLGTVASRLSPMARKHRPPSATAHPREWAVGFQARQANRNCCWTTRIVCGRTANGRRPAVGGETGGGWH